MAPHHPPSKPRAPWLARVAFLVRPAPLATVTTAHAATYHISETGSDANSCQDAESAATAKRNFMGPAGVIACVTGGGDRVLVAEGTYDEILDHGSRYSSDVPAWPSGTSWENAITVEPLPGQTATIRGIILGDCCDNSPLPQLSYWIFRGLRITGHFVQLGHHLDHIRLTESDLVATSGSAIKIYGEAEGLEIVNNKVHDLASLRGLKRVSET